MKRSPSCARAGAMPRSLSFEGHHYQLDGARLGPKPAHEIGIWLGAAKPRALALTGRVADGWAAPLMSYMPPAARSLRSGNCCATSPTCATSGDTCRCPTSTSNAELAAEASEATAAQVAFWPMHDLLLVHQGALWPPGPRALCRGPRVGRPPLQASPPRPLRCAPNRGRHRRRRPQRPYVEAYGRFEAPARPMGVGTRWERYVSPRGSSCPLVSPREPAPRLEFRSRPGFAGR